MHRVRRWLIKKEILGRDNALHKLREGVGKERKHMLRLRLKVYT
jgi:hypothetical protein